MSLAEAQGVWAFVRWDDGDTDVLYLSLGQPAGPDTDSYGVPRDIIFTYSSPEELANKTEWRCGDISWCITALMAVPVGTRVEGFVKPVVKIPNRQNLEF